MTGGPNAPTLTKTPVYMSVRTGHPIDTTPTGGSSRE